MSWSVSNKTSGISLTSDNSYQASNTFKSTTLKELILATTSISSSALKYFEIKPISIDGDLGIGISYSTILIDSSIGYSQPGVIVYFSSGKIYKDGYLLTSISSYIHGDIIGVSVDTNNNKIWFSKNGIYSGSDNPDTNIGGINFTFSSSIYPGLFSDVNSTWSALLITQTQQLSHKPSTFTALEGDIVTIEPVFRENSIELDFSTGFKVPSQFLGDGTADNTVFLRGDGHWSAVTGASGGTVTSVGLNPNSTGLSVSGSPITSSGTFSLSWSSQTAKYVLAAPNGTSGTPIWRQLQISDLSDSGNAASKNVGTTTGTVAAGDDNRITGALQSANDLSDLHSISTARTNLGLGTVATHSTTDFLQTANNLSDLASVSIARTNLGLGSIALLTDPLTETHGGTNQTSYVKGDTLYASASNTLTKLSGNTTTTKKFLIQTGDGVNSAAPAWGIISATDIPVFVASGASHAAGAVPDPGSSAGTTKFLREDATWAVPSGGSGTVTSVTVSSANSYISSSGSPITNSGTITLTANIGTTSNTLAAGDDSRITGAAQKSSNLSDLASVVTARVNLGIDKITTHGDSNYTILSTDKIIVTSASLTTTRTWTLPAANSVNSGYVLTIVDQAGGITSSNTLTISRAGSDTINDSTSIVLANAYDGVSLVSDGTSKWTYSVVGVERGGTGATTVSSARINLGLGSAATQNSTAFLQVSNNLSDLGSVSTARTNLGLGSIAVLADPLTETHGGTNQTSYAIGDTLYASATNILSKLSGNTTATKKFLTQTGTGSVSQAPGWNTIAAGDLPVFVASGASHASGAVPDPGSSAGTVNFLREDASWSLPELPYLLIRNEKTTGLAGGNTSNGLNTIPYNTVTYNGISGSSLASNLITLPAGTYRFVVRQQTFGASGSKIIIVNNTNSTDLFVCDSCIDSSGGVDVPAYGSGRFTIAAQKDIKVQLYVNTGQTNGFGQPVSSGKTEVFGSIEFWKVA